MLSIQNLDLPADKKKKAGIIGIVQKYVIFGQEPIIDFYLRSWMLYLFPFIHWGVPDSWLDPN